MGSGSNCNAFPAPRIPEYAILLRGFGEREKSLLLSLAMLLNTAIKTMIPPGRPLSLDLQMRVPTAVGFAALYK